MLRSKANWVKLDFGHGDAKFREYSSLVSRSGIENAAFGSIRRSS